MVFYGPGADRIDSEADPPGQAGFDGVLRLGRNAIARTAGRHARMRA